MTRTEAGGVRLGGESHAIKVMTADTKSAVAVTAAPLEPGTAVIMIRRARTSTADANYYWQKASGDDKRRAWHSAAAAARCGT